MFIQVTDNLVIRTSSITEVVVTEDRKTVKVDGYVVGLPYLGKVLDKLQIGDMLGNQLSPMTKLKIWLHPKYGAIDFEDIEDTYLTPEDFRVSKGLIHLPLEGELATTYKINPKAFNVFGIVPELQDNKLFYKE